MSKYKTIYQTTENVLGYNRKSRELITYKMKLEVKDGGKKPVKIDLSFIPPHPFAFEVPEAKKISGISLTHCYEKLVLFFENMEFQMRAERD